MTPPESIRCLSPRLTWAGWFVFACLALLSCWSVSAATAAEKDEAPAESAQEDTDNDTPAAKEKTEEKSDQEAEPANEDDQEGPQRNTEKSTAKNSEDDTDESTEEDTEAETEEKTEEKTPEKTDEKPAADAGDESSSTKEKAEEDDPPTKAEQPSQEPKETESKEKEDAAAEDDETEVEIEDNSLEEEPEEDKADEQTPPIAVEPDKGEPPVQKRVIGATATLMEKKSELLFRARVDTGAKSCSLHIEEMKIENESEQMADNIGKVVRFQIKNGDGESHWLEAKIAGYVIIKTSDNRERRYKVPLTFRYKDFEKEVLVTLNNRNNMEYPLLLGRNFLRDSFVVDVAVDSSD